MSSWRYMASLPSRMITGDFEASFLAQSSTAPLNRSAATTRFTIPIRSASRASIRSPSSSNSFVFLRGPLGQRESRDAVACVVEKRLEVGHVRSRKSYCLLFRSLLVALPDQPVKFPGRSYGHSRNRDQARLRRPEEALLPDGRARGAAG